MSFSRKRIDATITLGEGQFGATKGPSITLTGHRISAQLVANGLDSVGTCAARIYGMSLADMNQLTSIGPINQTAFMQNTLQLSAGVDGDALETVFFGSLLYTQGNLQRSPDSYLDVFANCGGLSSIKPVAPNSYRGATPVSKIMADLAVDAGFVFEDGGVEAVLESPYFYGSTLDKIRQCARAANIYFRIEHDVLYIWEAATVTKSKDIIELSPSNGLVNYPIFSSSGVVVKSIFNPRLNIGRDMHITGSEIIQANGMWRINGATHSIESEIPNGEWFSNATGYLKNVFV